MAQQNWKKFDPSTAETVLRDDPSDKFYQTAPEMVLPGISAERVIREIKGMLVGVEYSYAEITLRGILETIERTEAVTQGQWDAIERILNTPHRENSRRGHRRY